jgi:isopenicillin-N epimerase
MLCEALGTGPPAPESMIASLATVKLPDSRSATDAPPLSIDPIMTALWERHRIEVLASVWPASPGRVLRVSAQIYNEEPQYAQLVTALKELLAAGA